MKRALSTFGFAVAAALLAALVMTSAACPDGEVFCLVRPQPQE